MRARRKPRFDCLTEHIFADAAAQLELGRDSQRPIDEMMRQEGNSSLKRVSHGSTIEALQQRRGHVDAKIAKHELLDGPKISSLHRWEIRRQARRDQRSRVVAHSELAAVNAAADRGRGYRNSRKETLEAVVKQGAVPESQCMIAKVIELSGRKADTVEQAKSAHAFD